MKARYITPQTKSIDVAHNPMMIDISISGNDGDPDVKNRHYDDITEWEIIGE